MLEHIVARLSFSCPLLRRKGRKTTSAWSQFCSRELVTNWIWIGGFGGWIQSFNMNVTEFLQGCGGTAILLLVLWTTMELFCYRFATHLLHPRGLYNRTPQLSSVRQQRTRQPPCRTSNSTPPSHCLRGPPVRSWQSCADETQLAAIAAWLPSLSHAKGQRIKCSKRKEKGCCKSGKLSQQDCCARAAAMLAWMKKQMLENDGSLFISALQVWEQTVNLDFSFLWVGWWIESDERLLAKLRLDLQ